MPDDSPYTTGGIGLLGTAPSQEALEDCDTLLIVGTSFPYIEFYPKPGQARGVQIDLDPTRIGLRYPVEVGLVGDARRTLQALLPLLEPQRRTARSSRQAQDGMKEWRELMEERGTRTDTPMKPQVVAHELGKLLARRRHRRHRLAAPSPPGPRATSDMRGGRCSRCSGNLATMACGLPYAIAAADRLSRTGRWSPSSATAASRC